LGAGYNLLQARIAVGSGGLFGQGWLHGLQGQLGFVPERATDFVFAIFAEEFGLLGSLVLLAVFGTLMIRLLRTAAVAPDRFGELLAGGVFVMILVQVVQNVGMKSAFCRSPVSRFLSSPMADPRRSPCWRPSGSPSR
jgi:rod shape determining protein RodA